MEEVLACPWPQAAKYLWAYLKGTKHRVFCKCCPTMNLSQGKPFRYACTKGSVAQWSGFKSSLSCDSHLLALSGSQSCPSLVYL